MVGPEAFRAGQGPYSGAQFRYTDGVWLLPSQAKRVATSPAGDLLNFSALPEWMKMPAKEYLSWAWLGQDLSPSWLHGRLVMLRKLGDYIGQQRPNVRQLEALDRGVAEGFVRYLRQGTSPENAYRQACQADHFARWIRHQYNVAHSF